MNNVKHSNNAARIARIIRKFGAVSVERISHLTRIPAANVAAILTNEMPKFVEAGAGLWTWR